MNVGETVDLVKEFREGNHHRTIGWDNIAWVYKENIPEHFQKVEAAAYCGVLFGLAAKLRPMKIVEIGAQYGMATRMFLAATALTGGEVHSIDIDPECAARRAVRRVCPSVDVPSWPQSRGGADGV